TDGKGRTVSFQNAILIMTSNVGSAFLQQMGAIGYHPVAERAGKMHDLRDRLDEALRQMFKPEFLNRIDDIVYFNPLGEGEITRIIDLQVELLKRMLAEKKIRIELLPAAKQLLFRRGYDPNFGARPLRRAIQTMIQDPLALKLLDGEIQPGDTVTVDADPEKGVMTFEREAVQAVSGE
ncbi:MAG: AAA family ATPase, partial [Terriglobia bacterium]